MLAERPVEGVAYLVTSQPGALRDAVIGAVLKIRESELVAKCQSARIGHWIVRGKRRNLVDEIVLLVAQRVDLRGGKAFRPAGEKGIVPVKRLLAIGRSAQRPYLEAVVHIEGAFKGVAQRDMVIGIRHPVAFGGDAHVAHEGSRGAT